MNCVGDEEIVIIHVVSKGNYEQPILCFNCENAKQDHKEFWEGFTPAGEKPTMDEIVIWMAKKLTMKQEELAAEGEEEPGMQARYQVRESFLESIL